MEKNLELSDIGVIKRGQGLVYQGKVTAINGTTGVTVASLSGFGNDFFCNASYSDWQMYGLRDAGGAGAAPQGLYTVISDYVSTTGAFTITAFASGTMAVGDEVLIMHPTLAAIGTMYDTAVETGATTKTAMAYLKGILAILGERNTAAATGTVSTTDDLVSYVKQLLNIFQLADPDLSPTLVNDSLFAQMLAIDGTVADFDDNLHSLEALYDKMVAVQGGSETLESLDDELDAMIDMAKTPDTRTIATINVEETISAFTTTNTNPMYLAGIWLGMANLAANEVVRWRVFADWDDASIADQITDDETWTYGGVQSPAWKYKALGFWVTYEVRVKITQLAGTQREFYSVLDIGQRGS